MRCSKVGLVAKPGKSQVTCRFKSIGGFLPPDGDPSVVPDLNLRSKTSSAWIDSPLDRSGWYRDKPDAIAKRQLHVCEGDALLQGKMV